MPKKGTTTAIENGRPEIEKFGAPFSIKKPPATATKT